jgi:outer membrane immunogenic protein
MNKFLAVAAWAAVTTVSAQAADLAARPYTKAPAYVAPVASWTGFYAGANVGYGWGSRSGDLIANSPNLDTAVVLDRYPRSFGNKNDGVIAGGQIGYNHQINQYVFGLEADLQWADQRSSTFRSAPTEFIFGTFLPDHTESSSDRVKWFGTVRARAGVTPSSDLLLYVTGGLAYGETNSSVTNTYPAFPNVPPIVVGQPAYSNSVSVGGTRVGWSAGVGAEWMFASNWSVKAEYLHVDLGSTSLTVVDRFDPTDTLTYGFKHQQDTVRVGLNYKFSGPMLAKY